MRIKLFKVAFCFTYVLKSSVYHKSDILILTFGLLLGYFATWLFIVKSSFTPYDVGKIRPQAQQSVFTQSKNEIVPLYKEEYSLYSEVRILCWVMTTRDIEARAKHVKATWGRHCNTLLFMSSYGEPSLPVIKLNIPEGRDFLWGKTKAAFKYVYKHHFKDAEWFLKADDDTYFIMDNLRAFLHTKDPNLPVYYGRKFKTYISQGYMSGGAGYVLSKEALRKFIVDGLKKPYFCRSDYGGAEDFQIGYCLQGIQVAAGDTRDLKGRETFHPFVPEHLLVPDLLPRSLWYWKVAFYPIKTGENCCSEFSISFHYVPPNMMYTLEYIVHHMKLFGLKNFQKLKSKFSKTNKLSQYNKLNQKPDTDHLQSVKKESEGEKYDTGNNLKESENMFMKLELPKGYNDRPNFGVEKLKKDEENRNVKKSTTLKFKRNNFLFEQPEAELERSRKRGVT